MEPLISVIVPLYNAEKQLEKCINSILNQTYRNIELILVNDGSQDGSGQICDKFALIDDRVKIIHKSNAGVAAARNTGLDNVNGDFVVFVDSDDWLHKDFVSILYSKLQEYDADISVCCCNTINENQDSNYVLFESIIDEKFLQGKEVLSEYYGVNATMITVPWGKLYKTGIFKDIRYPEGVVFDDVSLILNILKRTNKMILIPNKLYNYYVHDGSIMNSKYNKSKVESKFKIFDLRMNALINEFNASKEILHQEMCIRLNDYGSTYRNVEDKLLKKLIKQDLKIKWKKYKKYFNIFKSGSLKPLINYWYIKLF